jgi:hypothetical protein
MLARRRAWLFQTQRRESQHERAHVRHGGTGIPISLVRSRMV